MELRPSIKELDLILLVVRVLVDRLVALVASPALVVKVVLVQTSISRTFSAVPLAVADDEAGVVRERRSKTRFWLARTSKCRPTYPSWTLQKVSARTSSSHR